MSTAKEPSLQPDTTATPASSPSACTAKLPSSSNIFPGRVLARCPECFASNTSPNRPRNNPRLDYRPEFNRAKCATHGWILPELKMWVCWACVSANEAFVQECFACGYWYGVECELVWLLFAKEFEEDDDEDEGGVCEDYEEDDKMVGFGEEVLFD